MANKKTLFQRLTDVVIGTGNVSNSIKTVDYNIPVNGNQVLYTYDNKEDRDAKLLQLRQQKLMSYQWKKTGYDTSIQQTVGTSQVTVMYRDANMMDSWPEIGSALDTYAEECVTPNKKGKILNIYSKSKRVASVLEDLFINRLDVHVSLEMIARCLCKYGNEFMLLNINAEKGVLGWRELPVQEMRRLEEGMLNMYAGSFNGNDLKEGEVKFLWEGHNDATPFMNWQVAHFRLIKDSLYLPYGASILNKARRSWRMLSMMEDAMLLYRLERSVERRIFKVNVGLIDDADVSAFLQEFMNNVKRAPIIDPLTGQMDLRKNFLDVSADYVIPIRNGQDPSTIDVLQPAQNPTSLEDIEYMQNKVLAALRVPKQFLNFSEAQGKGQNLSIMDIRFNRAVNSVQRALLMELTKVAIIHLYILGFKDELTNFTLTLNNPSNQIELMELENQSKRLANASAALAEQGCGIPLMSWHRVQKEIMGLTDEEISEMLNEIRIEAAIRNELMLTNQIIKKTGVFNDADNIYGELGAKYDYSQMGGEQGAPGGMIGGGGGGMMPTMDMGGDLGNLGGGGEESEMPLEDMGGQPDLMESKKNILNAIDKYRDYLNSKTSDKYGLDEIMAKAEMLSEGTEKMFKEIEEGLCELPLI